MPSNLFDRTKTKQMKKIILFTIITTFFLVSCKDKNSRNIKSKNITKTEDIVPENEDKKLVPIELKRDISEDRKKAEKEINSTGNSEEIPFFLTTNYYVVDYLMSGKGAPDDVTKKGEWYKFEKDKSYSHGLFEKTIEKGRFKFENEILLLYPDNKNLFPSEWRIMHSGDIIVMAGTSKFGNNAVQKHTQNLKEKPKE